MHPSAKSAGAAGALTGRSTCLEEAVISSDVECVEVRWDDSFKVWCCLANDGGMSASTLASRYP